MFQFSFVFGQCNVTEGTESILDPKVKYSPKVTTLKCSDGFIAPVNYEWMSPTKIYIKFYHGILPAGNGRRKLTSNVIYQNIEKVIWGNSLDDACQNIFMVESNPNAARNVPGYSYGTQSLTDNDIAYSDNEQRIENQSEFLCLDCGLGYYGVVVLQDQFDVEKYNQKEYSSSAIGFACGKATSEEAFKAAYTSAYKKLNKDAVAITYLTGVNTKFKLEKKSNPLRIDLYTTEGKSLFMNGIDVVNNSLSESLHIFSNNPEIELNYIKNHIPLTYNRRDGRVTDRNGPGGDACNCYFSFPNKYDVYQPEYGEYLRNIPNIPTVYPIFTEKIGNSSNQSGNEQDAGSMKSNAQHSNSDNSNNSSNETNRQNAQNYYNKSVDAEKSQAKIKATQELVQVGIKTIDGISDISKTIQENKEKREAENKNKFKANNSTNLVSDNLLISLSNDIVSVFKNKGFNFDNNKQYSIQGNEQNLKWLTLNFEGFDVNVTLNYRDGVMYKTIAIRNPTNEICPILKKKKVLEKYENKKAKVVEKQAEYNCGQYLKLIMILDANYSMPNELEKNIISIYNYENVNNNNYASELSSKQLVEKAEDLLDKYIGNKTPITKEDQNQAIEYLNKAIELGNKDAYEDLYFVYDKIGDYKTALYYIKEEIRIKPDAVFPLLQMGYYYQDGKGTEKNYLEAAKYYNMVLVIENNISANYKLGEIYKNGGFGISQDLKKAKAFFKYPCDLINYKPACDEYNSIK